MPEEGRIKITCAGALEIMAGMGCTSPCVFQEGDQPRMGTEQTRSLPCDCSGH